MEQARWGGQVEFLALCPPHAHEAIPAVLDTAVNIDAANRSRGRAGPLDPYRSARLAAERIQQLAGLRDQGLISTDEYEHKRTELLSEL